MTAPPAPRPVELARVDTPHGELALRRRGEVLELIVDGVFAMDTVDVATEEALADLALDRLRAAGERTELDVVVAGLGLGYTGRRVLAQESVRSVLVIELQQALVEWARRGLLPEAGLLLADPRVRVEVADVLDAVPALPPGSVDAVLLDVDNGPGFLIHQGNSRVYAPAFLAAALGALRPGGVLGVWSAHPEPRLAEDLDRLGEGCEEVLIGVERDGRHVEYALYLASTTTPAWPGTGPDGSDGEVPSAGPSIR